MKLLGFRARHLGLAQFDPKARPDFPLIFGRIESVRPRVQSEGPARRQEQRIPTIGLTSPDIQTGPSLHLFLQPFRDFPVAVPPSCYPHSPNNPATKPPRRGDARKISQGA